MVGFIDPVGTSFQSPNEERTENKITARINSGRTSLCQNRRARICHDLFAIGSLTANVQSCSRPINSNRADDSICNNLQASRLQPEKLFREKIHLDSLCPSELVTIHG